MIEVDGAAVMCSNQLVVVVGQFGGGGSPAPGTWARVPCSRACTRDCNDISFRGGESRIPPPEGLMRA